MKKIGATLIIVIFIMISMIFPETSSAAMYKFSGGPSGGTFQYYASAISELSQKNLKKDKIKVLAGSSGGSIENIRLLNSGKSNFAVAYSGDIFLAKNGKLYNDTKKYEDVLALCYFYGAPAQLIVKADAGITKTRQLEGKKVGVGNAGSGAAATCELFFTELGIWEKIEKDFLGYRHAADAFKNGQLDAFWIFAGFPNPSISEAAIQSNIAILNTYNDADEIGMFQKYPYFSKVIIPANTYKGVDKDITTFQDSTLWIANSKVPADDVYKLLSVVFSDEGFKFMVETHKSAEAMSIENGISGIVTPLHPGAEKFWKEKGTLK